MSVTTAQLISSLGLTTWAKALGMAPRPLPTVRIHLGSSDLEFVKGFSFEDGNIVLRTPTRNATSSRGETQDNPTGAFLHFRVHKSVLQSKSEFFVGMLRIGQSCDEISAMETKDLLPIVDVDDDPIDLTRLLQYIYHNHVYHELPNLQRRFEYLSSVLILADKYRMDEVAKACVIQIRRWRPATLRSWDEAEETVGVWKRNLPEGTFLNDHVIEPAGVIRVSRLVPDLRDLAPVAFYEISRLSYRCDAALASLPAWQDYLKNGGRMPRRSLLIEAESRKLWLGSNSLKAKINTLATEPETHLPTLMVDCTTRNPRTCSGKKWWEAWVRNHLLLMFAKEEIDVLAELRTLSALIESHGNVEGAIRICNDCKTGLSSDVLAMRGVIWNELPALFKEEI